MAMMNNFADRPFVVTHVRAVSVNIITPRIRLRNNNYGATGVAYYERVLFDDMTVCSNARPCGIFKYHDATNPPALQ